MSKTESNFRDLHAQFLSHIDPNTTKLPTPVVKETTQFSETLRKALVNSQTNPEIAENQYKSALKQRTDLLNNPTVQKDEKLINYLNNVAVDVDNEGDITSALQATWKKHADSYNEHTPEEIIPEMPSTFVKTHAQFIEYIDETQDTIKTQTQTKLQDFSHKLAAAIGHHTKGDTENAKIIYEQCLENRDTLLQDPKIAENEKITHYLNNVMRNAENNDSSITSALKTTTYWHSQAMSIGEETLENNAFKLDTVEEDTSPSEPLLSDKEWEELSAPKNNVHDLF